MFPYDDVIMMQVENCFLHLCYKMYISLCELKHDTSEYFHNDEHLQQATIINGIDQNPSFPCPMIQPLLSDCAI